MKRMKASAGLWFLVAGSCLVSAFAADSARAQVAILALEDAEVIPGEEFALDLRANLDRAIRGYQLGLEFPQYAMSILEATLDGTDLASFDPDVFELATSPGAAVVKLLIDDTAPFQNNIPAGPAVVVGRLRFRMEQGLDPGAVFKVQLMSNVGVPPAPALIYSSAGTVPPAGMVGGEVKIIDKNLLRIRDLDGVRPNSVQMIEVAAFNVSPLQGFSIGIRFDQRVLKFMEVDLDDTITGAVGAEYVAPVFDNPNGHFLLGVLLDAVPPFDNQVIPAAGLDLTLAKIKVQLVGEPQGSNSIELELVDGLGAPPIRNLFVIDNQSVAPVKQNGRVSLVTDEPFVRGDVSRDGGLDISDPIAIGAWLFLKSWDLNCHKAADIDDDGDNDLADMVHLILFLFNGGNPVPQPYPNAGFDPTPDDLPCTA